MKVYFVSSNERKQREVLELFDCSNVLVENVNLKINEIQCKDVAEIVRDKVKKAFWYVKRPVFVEQTGLYIDDFGGLPGGLTEMIWNNLHAEKFCDFFGKRENTMVVAHTVVGYCDGKNVRIFEARNDGFIASEPKGVDFLKVSTQEQKRLEWDSVFTPTGYDKTILELEQEGIHVSVREVPFRKLKEYLREE